MIFGKQALEDLGLDEKKASHRGKGGLFTRLKIVGAAFALSALFAGPQLAYAADPEPAAVQAPGAVSAPAATQAEAATAPAAPAAAASDSDQTVPVVQGSYTRMAPTPGEGQPVDRGLGLQPNHSVVGQYAHWIHDGILMPIITAISLLVTFLLIWVMVRYNRRANPVPSRTSHNTVIEVLWTLVPVLILVGIAVPSINLLAKQYKPAPANALTIKVTGSQWYWSYGYPDNGGFEFASYMLNQPNQPVINDDVREAGSDPSDGPALLEVDNRMVVPVGEPIRLQITSSDVIHSFAVPSLWMKMDAVPGRVHERVIVIDRPGVYYGQCSELCGIRHGYMPIAVEALPRDKYNAWVLTQEGGTLDKGAARAATAGKSSDSADKNSSQVAVGA